jgi:hypothetical protein
LEFTVGNYPVRAPELTIANQLHYKVSRTA